MSALIEGSGKIVLVLFHRMCTWSKRCSRFFPLHHDFRCIRTISRAFQCVLKSVPQLGFCSGACLLSWHESKKARQSRSRLSPILCTREKIDLTRNRQVCQIEMIWEVLLMSWIMYFDFRMRFSFKWTNVTNLAHVACIYLSWSTLSKLLFAWT